MLSWKTVSSPLEFHLELYNGPLDLLLDLIRRQQIDIRDIPIAEITAQYLEYMDKARQLDVDLGAEFVYMAATLIHIKSRMLLPRDPALAEMAPEEDPRQELVDRLLEHERFKNAAEMLQQKRMVEDNVWSNPQIQSFIDEEAEPALTVTLFDLVTAFGELLERAKNRPVLDVASEDVSVPAMINYLRLTLAATPQNQPIYILQLFEQQRSVRSMIAMFLAVLEMIKMQAVIVVQKELFGEITIRRHKRFDEVFAPESPAVALERDYA